MKLVSVSLMRNEADIVEAFVRYHMQFMDGMLIIDHKSSDNSAEIIRKLQDEGLNVLLEYKDSVAMDQARITTEAARSCLTRLGADWVCPLDLDEFIVPLGADDVRATFADLPADRLANIRWKTYIPTCSDEKDSMPLRRITHRLENEAKVFNKVILPASMLKTGGYSLGEGNHKLLDKNNKKVPAHMIGDLALAHFPVRSTGQILTKIFVGWLSRLSDENSKPGHNYQFRKLFDYFKKKQDVSCGELERIAAEYTKVGDAKPYALVCDPIRPDLTGFKLRYTAGYECDPVDAALKAAEEIAAELGRVKASENIMSRNNPFKRLKWHISNIYSYFTGDPQPKA